MFFYFLLIFALISEVSIQCSGLSIKEQKTPLHNTRVSPEDELVITDIPKRSCLCKGFFYPSCPEKLCQSDVTYLTHGTQEYITTSVDHDGDHPDHAIDNNLESDLVRTSTSKNVEHLPHYVETDGMKQEVITLDKSTPNDSALEYDSEGRIIRRRKIYVSDLPRKQEPIIHPLQITIPVEVDEPDQKVYSLPKPLFRMHKYTTVDRKSQVEMVPVTTTIIKPKGVKDEQILTSLDKIPRSLRL